MQAILFEIFKGVLSGVAAAVVFVFGQSVLRFVIEPAADLRKTIGEIGYLLLYQAHILHAPQSAPPDKFAVHSLVALPRSWKLRDWRRCARLPIIDALGTSLA